MNGWVNQDAWNELHQNLDGPSLIFIYINENIHRREGDNYFTYLLFLFVTPSLDQALSFYLKLYKFKHLKAEFQVF